MQGTLKQALMLGVFAGALALAGCVSITAVNGPYSAAGGYHVTLTRQWSDLTSINPNRPENVRYLSIDGPLLNRLYLASLLPGQSLVKHADPHAPRPTYRTDMSDTELVEFVTDCIAAMDYETPATTAIRPQSIGSETGVRFDISARTKEGLNVSGTALVARHGGRLEIMLFLAPSEYYYGSLMPDVERVFSSAQLGA